MSELTITNIDTGNVILRDAEFNDQLLPFAGAGNVLEGTILALDSISKKLVPFVKGGATNENGIPKFVLTYDVIALAAGDIAVRVMISGIVKKERLIIAADGDDTNVDQDVRDQLRDYKITVLNVEELGILDNQ